MGIFPSSEVVKNFGAFQEAAQSEPVTVTKYGRPYAVIMSAKAYDDLIHMAEYNVAGHLRSYRTNERGLRLFSPHQILAAYSAGQIDSGLAMVKLGLDHYRELAIALADAGLPLPGTGDDELSKQAEVAQTLLAPVLKGDDGA